MSDMRERAEARKKIATVTKIDLRSKEHDSFHERLDVKDAWNLLAKISKEAWFLQTGLEAPHRVDKSVYRLIKLNQKR